jgi:hypothetical protein
MKSIFLRKNYITFIFLLTPITRNILTINKI